MRYHNFFVLCLLFIFSCKNQKNEQPNDLQLVDSKNETKSSINQEKPKQNKSKKYDYKNPIKLDSIAGNKLEMLFSCQSLIYDEDYFRIPDYGCTYDPKYNSNNILGWADIILLIGNEDKKEYLTFSENEIYELEEEISNNCRENLTLIKERYHPIIFLVEKQYLRYEENTELSYYPKRPYVKKLFSYQNNGWYLLDSLKVFNEKDDYNWVDKNIINLTSGSRSN